MDWTPTRIDEAMEGWLEPLLGSSIVARTYRGSDPYRIGSVEGWDIRGEHTQTSRWEALELLHKLSQPAKREECVKLLVRLKTMTAGARQGEMDLEMTLEFYADDLQDYPLDVVRDACRTWPKLKGDAHKWFPSWPELQEMLDERFLKRKCLLDALERWAAA